MPSFPHNAAPAALTALSRDGGLQELFAAAFWQAPMGVALIGADRRFLQVNAVLCEMLGRGEDEIVGHTSASFTHPDDLNLTAQAYVDLADGSAEVAVEKRYLRPDGTVVWASTQGRAIRGGDGEVLCFISHFKDVTERRESQERQALTNARFEAAFTAAPIGMALVSLDGRLLKVNEALSTLLGHSREELLTRDFQSLTHPDDLAQDLAYLERVLSGELDRYTMDKRYFTATGGQVWAKLSVSVVRHPDGTPQYLVSHVEDISERHRMLERLRLLAERDERTGLWNSRRFEEELERQAARCRRYREHASVLVIDLDDFKVVNDTYGHRIGDELLAAVGRVISSRVRETDVAARVGGDEFAILLPGVRREETDALVADLRDAIAKVSVRADGAEVGARASIGAASLSPGLADGPEAFARADAAMYLAKARPRP